MYVFNTYIFYGNHNCYFIFLNIFPQKVIHTHFKDTWKTQKCKRKIEFTSSPFTWVYQLLILIQFFPVLQTHLQNICAHVTKFDTYIYYKIGVITAHNLYHVFLTLIFYHKHLPLLLNIQQYYFKLLPNIQLQDHTITYQIFSLWHILTE